MIITTVTNYGGGGGGGGAGAPRTPPPLSYTYVLYNRTSTIDDAHAVLTVNCLPRVDALPPTKAALMQYIRRAVYQVGQHAICSPGHAKLGIGQSKNWEPLWTTLPETRVSSRELLCCGCKKGCTAGRCKCKKAALNCTALCQCGGKCA